MLLTAILRSSWVEFQRFFLLNVLSLAHVSVSGALVIKVSLLGVHDGFVKLVKGSLVWNR